jgi:hypothetical protein
MFLYEHGEIIEDWREDDHHYGLFTIAHLRNYAQKMEFRVKISSARSLGSWVS